MLSRCPILSPGPAPFEHDALSYTRIVYDADKIDADSPVTSKPSKLSAIQMAQAAFPEPTVGVVLDAAEAFGQRLRITMLASGADFRAATLADSKLRPFRLGVVLIKTTTPPKNTAAR